MALALAATLSAAPTPDALAALSNPNSRLPRNAKAALRRAVPAVNEETREIQRKLEDAAYLMRIPQRKPWATMAKDVDESRKILLEKKADVFENIQPNDRAEAEEAYARLDDALERLSRAAATQDFDTFDAKIAQALDSLSVVQIAQAPGTSVSNSSEISGVAQTRRARDRGIEGAERRRRRIWVAQRGQVG